MTELAAVALSGLSGLYGYRAVRMRQRHGTWEWLLVTPCLLFLAAALVLTWARP
jgi:hypothetical protein